MTLRVATYNIRKCVGLDWQRRPDRILQVLSEIDADVVALQEADRRLGARPATLPAGDLFERTRLRFVDPGSDGPNSGWHGNAILVRKGIEVVRTQRLDLPSFEPRGALIADLVVGGALVRVACVHLGLLSIHRGRQARALLGEFERLGPSKATVVLGDLNEWSRAGAASTELSKSLNAAPLRRSFHTAVPIASLDRIFVCPALRVGEVGTHLSAAAKRASDHLPVWADLVRAEAEADAGSVAESPARTAAS